MPTDLPLRGVRPARVVLGTLALLLAACALHAVVAYDAGPLTWLIEKWGYNVVLAGSGLACLARGGRGAERAPRPARQERAGTPRKGGSPMKRAATNARPCTTKG